MNKKNTLNYPKSAAMFFFPKGLKNEFETAVVNEPSVFEPLKFYCILFGVLLGCLLLPAQKCYHLAGAKDRLFNCFFSGVQIKWGFEDNSGIIFFILFLAVNPVHI